MKKTILILALVVLALEVFGVGAAFAQDGTPAFGGRGPVEQDGTRGPLHTFMFAEFANKLDLNAIDIHTRREAGESIYDIAFLGGVTAEEFPAVMTEIRTSALDAALKGDLITQEQADLDEVPRRRNAERDWL